MLGIAQRKGLIKVFAVNHRHGTEVNPLVREHWQAKESQFYTDNSQACAGSSKT